MELKTHEGNLEVGLTKRLIGIKREVYDFMGESISQSDSINGQASIYQDKSLLGIKRERF